MIDLYIVINRKDLVVKAMIYSHLVKEACKRCDNVIYVREMTWTRNK